MRGLALALLFASSGAAAPARALPITLHANVDFGADHAEARERIGASSGSASAPLASAPLAVAPLAVTLDVAVKPKQLASAPLEVSFRRWDEGPLSVPDASLALAVSGR